MKKLALFDFDGTITEKDSLIEFIQFTNGFFMTYFGLFLLSPVLILYKLKVIPNYKAKEMVMRYFWFGRKLEWMKKQGGQFSMNKLPEMIREDALKRIRWYVKEGWDVYIVSASSSIWTETWAEREGVKFIGTKLKVTGGTITGRIDGRNCYGKEKVNRLKEELIPEEYEIIHAYGDTAGDHEMLKLAHRQFYKPFRA